jgi:hypothetical protein
MDRIVDDLNAEIDRLIQARNLLLGGNSFRRGRRGGRVGAPPGRVLSADARRRISEGMKKRWAERRKAQAAKRPKAA